MLRRLTAIGVFLLAIAPSAYLAWTLRSMPHLGYYHDDGIYWVSAKSLAEGGGYRIPSLPADPYQTKYPPLYPALLAGIWKLNPSFPGNLPDATLLAWLCLPLVLFALWHLLSRYGFDFPRRCALLIVAGWSPVVAVFSFSLMPELLFTALLLLSLILAERAGADDAPMLAAFAGMAAALAYLTKSIAAPLLITVPACFLLRRRAKSGMMFFATMAPAVAGWQWWVARHMTHAQDRVSLYYTNYLGFQIYNVPLEDLGLVIWHNLDTALMGIGRLLTFDVPVGSKHLERVIAVAAIAGAVRLTRRTGLLQYPVAALGMAMLLLIWHYPPDQRMVFPLYPLLLAGLLTELENIRQALAASWRKPAFADRTAAAAGAGLLAALASFVGFTTIYGLGWFLPSLFGAYRADLDARRPAYAWISANAPRDANLYAYDDPLLYLYTGRRSCSIPIPSKFGYHNNDAGIDRLLDATADFAHEQHLDFVLLTSDEFYRDLHERGAARLKKAVDTSGVFAAVFHSGGVTVYRYQGEQASLRRGL